MAGFPLLNERMLYVGKTGVSVPVIGTQLVLPGIVSPGVHVSLFSNKYNQKSANVALGGVYVGPKDNEIK